LLTHLVPPCSALPCRPASQALWAEVKAVGHFHCSNLVGAPPSSKLVVASSDQSISALPLSCVVTPIGHRCSSRWPFYLYHLDVDRTGWRTVCVHHSRHRVELTIVKLACALSFSFCLELLRVRPSQSHDPTANNGKPELERGSAPPCSRSRATMHMQSSSLAFCQAQTLTLDHRVGHPKAHTELR
jgi:hypothetical protein